MTIHTLAREVESELIPRIVGDLRGGLIWGLHADSAYALVADAFNLEAVQRIQALKGRSGFMSPILIGRDSNLDGIVSEVTPELRKLTDALWPGPLAIVVRPTPSLAWAASRDAISVRMPVAATTRQIAWELGPLFAVAATKVGSPAPLTAEVGQEIWASNGFDWLDAGAADPNQLSTVVDFRGDVPNIVRLGALSRAELKAVLPSVTMVAD